MGSQSRGYDCRPPWSQAAGVEHSAVVVTQPEEERRSARSRLTCPAVSRRTSSGIHHLIDREARRTLTGRVLLERLQEGGHPPHAVLEQIGILRQPVVVLIGDDVRALVRIHARLKTLGARRHVNGLAHTTKPPGARCSQNTIFQLL